MDSNFVFRVAIGPPAFPSTGTSTTTHFPNREKTQRKTQQQKRTKTKIGEKTATTANFATVQTHDVSLYKLYVTP